MKSPIPLYAFENHDEAYLVKNYEIRRELAQTLAEHSFNSRAELLKVSSIMSIATSDEIVRLMRPSRYDTVSLPGDEVISNAEAIELDGIILGVHEIGQAHRIFIGNDTGEVISADLAPDTNMGIDVSSLRLVGHSLPELTALSDVERVRGEQRLHAVIGNSKYQLWYEEKLPTPCGIDPQAYKFLSAVLDGMTYPIRLQSESALKPNSLDTKTIQQSLEDPKYQCGPGDSWIAKYLVPESNVTHCCVEHDYCYERGGCAAEKGRCDLAFFDCIRKRHPLNPVLAAAYMLL